MCINCTHGDGKPVTCCVREGPLRGGFCLFCDSKAENSFIYDPNSYSFNDASSNFNHLPYETYLCELCGNNSHYGYDCQPQFPFVYEQEPSYNQNYNDNHYLHDSPSFLCCDNCGGGSHETFQCQPMDQNIDSSGLDQIQTLQYPVIHQPSQEISKEVFQAKGDLMKSIQTFLDKFNCIPFREMPKILLQAWEKFLAIQHAQPEDSNELFQKLLKDLQIVNKELEEYINSPSWDRPIFFNDNEEHYVQYKQYLENPSNEIAASNSNQEKKKPPQDSDIRQLVREECYIEVCKKQKQNMENTLLELIEVCRQKEFYCMHNNEVKNIVEEPTKCGTRIVKSLQNFRIKKNSISLNNTSQISSVHAITPVLPTEEPEYSLSMGYEHLSTIPKIESDEVIKSSAKNLLPILSEYEVTFDDESECEVPVKDESSPVFTTFSIPLFDDNDDFTSSDDESLSDEDVQMKDFKVYSNPLFDNNEINSDKIDPHCFNTESGLIESLSNHDTLFNPFPKFDYLEEFSGALMPTIIADGERIRREHEEYISLMEKLFSINSFPRPLENFHANMIDETLPTSPIPVEDSDSFREEIDILTGTDDLLPPGIESDDYDSEREIYVLEELLVDDSISFPENEAFNFDHQDDLSFPRPPSEPPDVEFFFDLEPDLILVMINNIDELNEDEYFDPGGEINVFTNVEDDD
nr:hypothetical protein [Tanacetum cinerariifolium]